MEILPTLTAVISTWLLLKLVCSDVPFRELNIF